MIANIAGLGRAIPLAERNGPIFVSSEANGNKPNRAIPKRKKNASKRAKLCETMVASKCKGSVTMRNNSNFARDRAGKGDSKWVESKTNDEEMRPMRAMPKTDTAGLGCAKLCRVNVGSSCRRSVADVRLPVCEGLCIEMDMPGYVKSSTGSENTSPGQAIPKRNAGRLGCAKLLDVSVTSNCRRLVAINITFRHPELCRINRISKCVESITNRENTEPDRAKPENDTTGSTFKELCNESDMSKVMKSKAEELELKHVTPKIKDGVFM